MHNCPEYFSFKIETIRWINSGLWKGDPGLRDATLGSIMLLTDLEVSFYPPAISSDVAHRDLHSIINITVRTPNGIKS